MGKKPEVSLEKRAEINVLLSEGLSQKEIAIKLNISQSAVSKIIKRIIEFGTYTPKPRPGRPKVKKQSSQYINQDTVLPNLKLEKGFGSLLNIKSENHFSHERVTSFPFAVDDAPEDNFFLSLCEIENSIKNSEDEPEKHFLEYADPKPETEKSKRLGNNKFKEDNTKTFVKLEGRKIKTEKKRSYSPPEDEEEQHHFTKIKRYHEDVGTVQKQPVNFIKTEKQPCHVSSSDTRSTQKFIKTEKIYVEDDYVASNNRNNFNNSDNYHSDNKISGNCSYHSDNEASQNNQVFYPSFTKRNSSSKEKPTEYFKIYNKALKRHCRKSDIRIKPTKFVKISERKRYHDRRRTFTSPQKINFHKKHYY